ncbi:hypothetical protein CRG98_046388 [Punica granatum]|uniref:Serine-threonine/tyrosine-protein kinase catalytic domain-containing protein n=1 Tax=Punica granatum TaxID=22663 RepID=A0A2I0HNB6_PUNGR|nr:hypothetical protein CRG98_046388 [Punica granatum]
MPPQVRPARSLMCPALGLFSLELLLEEESTYDRIDRREGLVDWIWELYGNKKLLLAADSKLSDDFNETEMECLMIVGFWCAHPQDSKRPSIQEAMNVLSGRASLPGLPPEKPVNGDCPL